MDDKPYYAQILLGCWKCTQQNVPLQRCGGCKRICYCSTKCQKDDWAEHKSFCKALIALENTRDCLLMIGRDDEENYFDTKIEQANYAAKAKSSSKFMLVSVKARRDLNDTEKRLIAFEPRCLACARTAQEIRMEEMISPGTRSTRAIRACDDCGYSFYCSDEHYESTCRTHSEIPYEDGHDGLSQCKINQEIRLDLEYADIFKGHPHCKVMYHPGDVRTAWESLEGKTWHSEYMPSIMKLFGPVEDERMQRMLRRDTNMLTLPMTILFALEKLNLGDDSWTRKEVLTIHCIGADIAELSRQLTLDEIFHHLPDLKEIKFLLCGPDFRHASQDQIKETQWIMTNCPSCAARGNKVTQTTFPDTYHAYVKQQGTGYTKPDIAVAFNSGCGAGLETQSIVYRMLDALSDTSSWRETEKFLVEKKIPTLFTANNCEEAIVDEQRLILAGAKFVPGLERQRNPWGSILNQPRPNMVRGFQSYNRWIVGGFR